jgi:hypothetical protein
MQALAIPVMQTLATFVQEPAADTVHICYCHRAVSHTGFLRDLNEVGEADGDDVGVGILELK